MAHDSGLRGVIVKDVGVLLQLGHRVLHGRDVPDVIAVHDLRKAECSLDHKARGQLVELAIGLAGLNNLGDEALARQLGVAVDQLVEVGQDALGRVALDGQILGQEHVGDDAGCSTAMMRASCITAKLLKLLGLMSLSIQSSSFSEVSLDEM